MKKDKKGGTKTIGNVLRATISLVDNIIIITAPVMWIWRLVSWVAEDSKGGTLRCPGAFRTRVGAEA